MDDTIDLAAPLDLLLPDRRALGKDGDPASCDIGSRLASRDPLLRCLETQWRWCRKQQHPVCLMLVGVDQLAALQSTFGEREVRSSMAATASAILKGCRRRADYAGLIASSQFAVLLSDTGADGARVVAERILGLVADADGPAPNVSIGAACMVPHSSPHVMDLVHRADRALAECTDSERVRVVTVEDTNRD